MTMFTVTCLACVTFSLPLWKIPRPSDTITSSWGGDRERGGGEEGDGEGGDDEEDDCEGDDSEDDKRSLHKKKTFSKMGGSGQPQN